MIVALWAVAVSVLAAASVFVWCRLRQSSELPLDHPHFETFLGESRLALAVVDGKVSKIRYATPEFNRLLGGEATTFSARQIVQRVHPDDLDLLRQSFADLASHPFQIELRLGRNDPIRWVQLAGHSLPAPRGTGTRVVLEARDITTRKNDELSLVEARDYEVSVGARIQRTLLLAQPDTQYAAFDFASMSLPSQMIDGDFLDFFAAGEEVLDLVVGDVMGKGIPAALTGAAAKNALVRSRMDLADERGRAELRVRDIVGGADRLLAHTLRELRTFFTLVYGRVDARRGVFSYVDCGHTSVIHYDASSGECWKLKGADMPVGFAPHQQYQEYAVPLDEGDLLFLYSDGISEAVNSEGDMFGEERILKLVKTSADLDAQELLDKIKYITFSYAAGDFRDDVTGVAVKITAKTAVRRESLLEVPQEMDSLPVLHDFFERKLKSLPPEVQDGDRREAILLALREAASNIFRHNESEPGVACRASIRISGNWAAFTFYYRGTDYDWQNPDEPEVENYQTGGYGLYLINEVMDSVTSSLGEENRVRLCMFAELSNGEGG